MGIYRIRDLNIGHGLEVLAVFIYKLLIFGYL